MELLVDRSNDNALARKNQVAVGRGRLPWFDVDGQPAPAYLIGVSGGSASGKTSVAQRILRALDVPSVLVISMDSYYKELTPEQSKKAFDNQYDFDSPDAFDYPALRECIADLRQSKAVQIPVYSFKEHQRMPETQYLYGASVVIGAPYSEIASLVALQRTVEGILVLHDAKLRELLDLKVFVQCDSDIMLARRIKRDIQDRGRDVEGVLQQYLKFVKPSFDNHILPTSRHADIIMPGFSNEIAIDIIVTHIRKELDARNRALRNQLSKDPSHSLPATPKPGSKILSYLSTHQDCETHNLTVLPQSEELETHHTALRSPSTPAADFREKQQHLADLLVEKGLSMIGAQDKSHVDRICAVTIAGVGARLQEALERAAPSVPIGSLTIQSHEDTAEPVLCRTELPEMLRSGFKSANEAHVLLLDSQVGTGAAAIMSARVLLDHGVKEESIVLVCFVCSRRGGCRALQSAFPGICMLTSCVDEGLEHLQTDGHTAETASGSDSRHPWTTFFVEPP